jgi:fluoroquinolone transport system permease protein
MSAIAALLTKDLRVVARDGMLAFLFFYPLLMAAVVRFIPGWFAIDHLDIYLAPAAPIMAPPVIGMILGFALIEERENRTWLLLRVVPLAQTTLLGYLVVTSSGLSLVTAVLAAWIYGLPVGDWTMFFVLAASASLTAPLLAFMLGSTASNKIEGLVVAKLLGLLPISAALVFVLPPAWQILLIWNPFYWLYLGWMRVYTGADAVAELAVSWPPYPLWSYAVVPVALCAGGVWPLASIYRRRAG